ncbi:hypothetical protein Tco_0405052 [Tanacetum coccineum]
MKGLVILFGTVPDIIPEVPIVPADPLVALEVGAVYVISPTEVLDLVDYSSSSDYDPSKDSLPPVPELPSVSPFLCSDYSEAESESESAEVASRSSSPPGSSSHDTLAPSSEFPLALTARKRVGPFPARRLAWRRVSHHSSPDSTSDSSSFDSSLESSSNTSSDSSSDSLSDSSSVHSSGCDSSGQAHSGPSTRVVSPRLVYPPVLTPRHSKAYRRWRSVQLSTPYPPTTSESSLDSSFVMPRKFQVMAAPVISISSDVSVESVGSSFPRVILIGSISVEAPITPEMGAAAVASHARVLGTHSSSEADPSESSPSPVSVAPMVSPFLCSDESDRVASRSSSPATSTLEIPTAPILPAPSAIVTPSSEFPLAPGIDREEVDHSSSGHSISGHSLSRHASPDTTVADSSTPPRFVHPPLNRTPWCSEAYLHWRSLAAIVTSSIHATRALVPSHADLPPPRKRFRDSISPEDSVEEDIDMDVLEDIKADAMVVEVAVDRDVVTGIDVGIDMEVDVGIDVRDKVESSDRERLEHVEEGLQDIYKHVIEIPLQRIEDIKMGQRELEARSLIAGGERDGLLEQVASLERSNNMTITRSGITPEAIEELVNRRVEEALAAYEATRAANALEAESQSQNGSDGDNGNGGNRNGGDGNSGDGNG